MHHQQALQPHHLQQQHQVQPYLLKEDEKIPLFLIKLWNIVEDPAYFDVIRWDESGYSFHITDPYSFCRNVLPQYFKHNNLNSLIRQLNMYGFRKMTPIERTSLARAESDQDHLEFSHPYFVRNHPELLINIKRKVPLSKQAHEIATAGAGTTVNVPVKDLSSIFEELRQLRERQKNMDMKMNNLVKDNELIWRELDHVRGAHIKQQQIVNKLVQFLVAVVQPNKQQRLGKRHLLAIDDEYQTKRLRNAGPIVDDLSKIGLNAGGPLHSIQSNNTNEVLDALLDTVSLSTGPYIGSANNGGHQSAASMRQPSAPVVRHPLVTNQVSPRQGGGSLALAGDEQQAGIIFPPVTGSYIGRANNGGHQPAAVRQTTVPVIRHSPVTNQASPLQRGDSLALAGDEQQSGIIFTPVTPVSGSSAADPDTGLQLSDFEAYISNNDDSIKNIHSALGTHWDDSDFLDDLLEESRE